MEHRWSALRILFLQSASELTTSTSTSTAPNPVVDLVTDDEAEIISQAGSEGWITDASVDKENLDDHDKEHASSVPNNIESIPVLAYAHSLMIHITHMDAIPEVFIK